MTKINLLVVAPGVQPSVLQAALLPLKKTKPIDIRWRYLNIQNVNNKHLEWADTVLVVRGFNYQFCELLLKAKVFGCKVIYDIDDHIAMIPSFSGLTRKHPPGDTAKAVSMQLFFSDIVRVYSNEMQNQVSNLAKHKTMKCLTWQEESTHQNVLRSIKQKRIDDSSCRIVFPSSNEFDDRTESVIFGAINRVADDFAVTFYSFQKNRPQLLDKRVNFVRLKSTASNDGFIKRITRLNCHLGIAPINDSSFYRAKAPAKIRDFASIGIPGVYSNFEPYSGIIEHEVNGMLADQNVESWEGAIRKLINNKKEANDIVDESKKLLENVFSLHKFSNELLNQVRSLGKKQPVKPELRGSKLGIFDYGLTSLEFLTYEKTICEEWKSKLEKYFSINHDLLLLESKLVECNREEFTNSSLRGDVQNTFFLHNTSCSHPFMHRKEGFQPDLSDSNSIYRYHEEFLFFETFLSKCAGKNVSLFNRQRKNRYNILSYIRAMSSYFMDLLRAMRSLFIDLRWSFFGR